MKASSTYKMSKQAKIYKAVNWHRPGIGSIMRATIQAEIMEKIQPRSRRDQKGTAADQ